jgi:predicted DNA-binding WGR domain protein
MTECPFENEMDKATTCSMADQRRHSLMIERDLFGTNGQELVEVFATEAGHALEAVAAAKRRRGYRDL